MQKILLPLALLVITLTSCAQSSGLDRFYNKFSADGKVSGDLSLDPAFLLNASFSGDSNNDNKTWLHKITRVRLLILDAKKTPSVQGEWSELSQSLKEDRFDELLMIRKGKERLQLLSKDGKDGQKEVAFLAGDKEGSGIFIHFCGHFTAKDLEQMQSSLQNNDKD